MTVQQLFNKAVLLIGDMTNILTYSTGYFDFVSSIVEECVRQGIGLNPKACEITITTPPYVTTETGFQAVSVPTDLTAEDQIIAVETNGNEYYKTESHLGVFYLLMPDDYRGTFVIRYSLLVPAFTTMADVLPISDSAVNMVAQYGLAKLLSVTKSEDKTAWLSSEYEKAKSEWVQREYNAPKQVRDVYDFII